MLEVIERHPQADTGFEQLSASVDQGELGLPDGPEPTADELEADRQRNALPLGGERPGPPIDPPDRPSSSGPLSRAADWFRGTEQVSEEKWRTLLFDQNHPVRLLMRRVHGDGGVPLEHADLHGALANLPASIEAQYDLAHQEAVAPLIQAVREINRTHGRGASAILHEYRLAVTAEEYLVRAEFEGKRSTQVGGRTLMQWGQERMRLELQMPQGSLLRTQVDRAMAQWSALTSRVLDELEAGGVYSREEVDYWRGYRHYSPLWRPEPPGPGSLLDSMGFVREPLAVRQASSRPLNPRRLLPDSIVQLRSAVISRNNNDVLRQLGALVANEPLMRGSNDRHGRPSAVVRPLGDYPENWQTELSARRKFELRQQADRYRPTDTEIKYYDQGRPMVLQFHNQELRDVFYRISQMSPEAISRYLLPLRAAVSVFKFGVTTTSPRFWTLELFRNSTNLAALVRTTDLREGEVDFNRLRLDVARYAHSGVNAYLQYKAPRLAQAASRLPGAGEARLLGLLPALERAGGLVKFVGSNQLQQLLLADENTTDEAGRSRATDVALGEDARAGDNPVWGLAKRYWTVTSEGAAKALEAAETFAAFTDNGFRVALYAALLDQGVPADRAAQVSRKIFDLGQKGTVSARYPALNQAFYPFFNVSMTGMGKLGEFVATPEGRKIYVGMMLAAFTFTMMNDEEEDEMMVNTSPFWVDGGMVFTLGDSLVRVPVTHLWMPALALGRNVAWAVKDVQTPLETAAKIVDTLSRTAWPLHIDPPSLDPPGTDIGWEIGESLKDMVYPELVDLTWDKARATAEAVTRSWGGKNEGAEHLNHALRNLLGSLDDQVAALANTLGDDEDGGKGWAEWLAGAVMYDPTVLRPLSMTRRLSALAKDSQEGIQEAALAVSPQDRAISLQIMSDHVRGNWKVYRPQARPTDEQYIEMVKDFRGFLRGRDWGTAQPLADAMDYGAALWFVDGGSFRALAQKRRLEFRNRVSVPVLNDRLLRPISEGRLPNGSVWEGATDEQRRRPLFGGEHEHEKRRVSLAEGLYRNVSRAHRALQLLDRSGFPDEEKARLNAWLNKIVIDSMADYGRKGRPMLKAHLHGNP